jgi:hypothetical protein
MAGWSHENWGFGSMIRRFIFISGFAGGRLYAFDMRDDGGYGQAAPDAYFDGAGGRQAAAGGVQEYGNCHHNRLIRDYTS